MQSPPLHHPVPQHQINFDAVNAPFGTRVAPVQGQPVPGQPPTGQSATGQAMGYGYPQMQPQMQMSQGSFGNSAFNPLNFVGGADLGKHALNYGQQYISQSLGTYGVNANSMRYYFQVTNGYVVRKLGVILFPWRHKPWNRQLQPVQGMAGQETYAFPSEDINAPDMYIPIMAFITHLVVIALSQGLQGKFHPDQFGARSSKALALVVGELMLLKLFTYLLAASASSLTDLCAYSGYKFVAVTLTTLAGLVIDNRMVQWLVFAYTGGSTAFFMLRSLKYILLPEYSPSSVSSPATTISGSKRQQRIQFLFFYGVICQIALMWLLL